MTFDPLTTAIDAQSEAIEAFADATEQNRLLPERLAEMESVEVGQTPSEVVYEENKLELLHYESRTEEQHDVPILIVWSLINRPYILDLQPDRSVIRRLLDAGHDIYMINWNEPSRLDQHLTLADYVDRYIGNCVDVVRDRSGQDAINLLGYCMGGTMTALYAARYPDKVAALGQIAGTLCFDDTGGVLELWAEEEHFDPEGMTDLTGNVPAEMLADMFDLMDPVRNSFTKYVDLYENIDDEDFVENFARMERWLDEGIDLAGDYYVEFIRKVYQDNALCRNEFELGGEPVDIGRIDMPVLQIVGKYDNLVPPACSKPFNDLVGSDDTAVIEFPTGHIGISVSSASHDEYWPRVADWFMKKSGESAAIGSDDGAAEEATTADADPIEAVDGIGPTYADRLRAAGIETTADLANQSASELAESTGAGESRAAGWLDQV